MFRQAALLATALLAASAHAITKAVPPTRPVAVLAPIGFAERATAMEWIKGECDLPRTVEHDLVEVFRDTGVGGETTTSLASGYVVKVVIERANGQKGGHFSGPKTLSLSATLYGDGVLLRSTEVSVETRSLNLFAGSCTSFQKASGGAAAHVSEWLRNVEFAKSDHLSAAAPATASSAP
jgi:hypothetical protein